MSGTRCGSQALRGVLLLSLLLNVGGLLTLTEYPTMPSVFGAPSYVITKPWKPLFIGNGTIPEGDKMVVTCTLQAGKRYHIFLVGDYVNEANPQTDYDIFVYPPSGPQTTHTEATGMPEQVANDAAHQFYVARSSGTYRFEIHNDPEDTKNGMAEPAVFMVIEHIDTDKRLSTSLMGRLLPSDPQNPASTWACEFTTPASNFTVYVDTPDGIDMFEARVYPMANPGTTGYEIWGVPTPNGDLLNGTVEGGYGGFNTTIGGYRPASLTASCEHMGEKMKINVSGFGSSNSTSASLGVSYFLVLIAEYSRGGPSAVPFYIRTDTSKPVLSLSSPFDLVSSNSPVKMSANVSSKRPIMRVWMNYTVNGVAGAAPIYLQKIENYYEGELPSFAPKDHVNCTLSAEDEIGNVGRLDSSFKVKARTETSLYVSKGNVVGGDTVEVTGQTTLAGANLKLNFTSGSFNEIVPVKVDQLGGYKCTYLPKQAGTWSVSAKFDGDDATYPSKSSPASFTMTPQPTMVSCTLDSPEIKVNQVLQLSGLTTPAVSGLPVEVTLASGSVAKTETLITKGDGSFSLSTPLEEGEWDVVAQVRGNWRYASSSSGIVKATVHPLGILDQATTPPYLYVVVLAAVVGVILVVRWRVGDLSSRMPKPVQDLLAKLSRKPKARRAGATGRYRRREEDS